MSKSKRISPAMVFAIELAEEHSGKLVRHTGGYWAGPGYKAGDEYAATGTVLALIGRGVVDVSKRQTFTRFETPVEVTLNENWK